MLSQFVRHPLFLATLSGLLLAASFPGRDWNVLAFFALIPLFMALDHARPLQGLGRGFVTGFVFFLILYSWIPTFAAGKVGAIGVLAGVLLAAVMAMFIALPAACVAALPRGPRIGPGLRAAFTASVWVLGEYVRQLGSLGMGWGDLAYTQWRDPLFLRMAPLAGVWGMSWCIVLIGAALASRSRRAIIGAAVAVAAMIAIGPIGDLGVRAVGPPYVAAALQADINQDVPWTGGRPSDPVYYADTLKTFADMARVAHGRGAVMAAMAETATPGYVRFDSGLRESMQQIASSNDLTIVAGSRDTNLVNGLDHNVAVLFSPHGATKPLQMYVKQQLVPFGEYVPFASDLKWLTVLHVASFNDEPGGADQPALAAGRPTGKIGVAICYESSYPRFTRQQVRAGAQLLTVITDDTWFGRTAAAMQHFTMSAVRAAECDRCLVRCASTGISGIFGPTGRVLAEAGLFRRAVVTATVQSRAGETVFVRYGDWPIGVFAMLAAAIAALASATRERRSDDGRNKPWDEADPICGDAQAAKA